MKLTLTADIENALIEAANQQGTTPETIALDCLRQRFASQKEAHSPVEAGSSLADFLSGHIGVIASGEQIPGGACLSEKSGQKFTAELLKQQQQERL